MDVPRRLTHAFRIVDANAGAGLLKLGDQRQRGRLPHVVGVRLEGKAEHGNLPICDRAIQRGDDPRREALLPRGIGLHRGFNDAEAKAGLARRLDERHRILRKA
jgi:hypothetical protein